MNPVRDLSVEESMACQLADLAVQLHKRGLIEPFKKVAKARDVLLLILDKKEDCCFEKKTTGKKETGIVTKRKSGRLVVPTHLLQDKEIRKSEYAAA